MNGLNCWIDKAGTVTEVSQGRHLIEQRADDVIRVSMSESRRTWLGIETRGTLTDDAKRSCRRIVRDARKAGLDIRAEVNGRCIEVMRHDRPTELNRVLA